MSDQIDNKVQDANGVKSASDNAYSAAIRSALPVPTGERTPTSIVYGDSPGILGRFFENAEARKHRETEEVIRNSATEVVLATDALSLAADHFVAAAAETERGFEETLEAYRDHPLAIATAPTYIQMARSEFTRGAGEVLRAGVDRIRRKISR